MLARLVGYCTEESQDPCGKLLSRGCVRENAIRPRATQHTQLTPQGRATFRTFTSAATSFDGARELSQSWLRS